MYCLAQDGVMPGFVQTELIKAEDFQLACEAVLEWYLVHDALIDDAIWAPQEPNKKTIIKGKCNLEVLIKEEKLNLTVEPQIPSLLADEQEELAQLREEKQTWEEDRAALDRDLEEQRYATEDAQAVIAELRAELEGRQKNDDASEVEKLKADLETWKKWGNEMEDSYYELKDNLRKAERTKVNFKLEMEEMMKRHFEN